METYLPTLTVAGVLGFLAPLLSTALSKLTWKPQAKQLMAVLVSVVMAVIALAVTNGFRPLGDGEDAIVYWITTILAVIAVSQLAFSLVWRPTEVEAKIAVATATKNELSDYRMKYGVDPHDRRPGDDDPDPVG